MMFRNWSTVFRRLREDTVASSRCPRTEGTAPSEPDETSAFCAVMAEVTSDGISE